MTVGARLGAWPDAALLMPGSNSARTNQRVQLGSAAFGVARG